MAHWEWIDNFAVEYHQKGREVFLRDHPQPFLVFQPPAASDELTDRTSTVVVGEGQVNLARNLSKAEARRLAKVEGFRVIPIAKHAGRPTTSEITVGRGPDNDLVIPHPTVSRLHAYFSRTADGRFAVTDASSRNGTRINGSRLQVKWTATLMPNDRLAFGEVEGTFQPAATFCEFLAMLSREW